MDHIEGSHRRLSSGCKALPSSPEESLRTIRLRPSMAEKARMLPPFSNNSCSSNGTDNWPFYMTAEEEKIFEAGHVARSANPRIQRQVNCQLGQDVVEFLQRGKCQSFKASILQSLCDVMNALIQKRIESLTKEFAELHLIGTQPGTYVMRASVTEAGSISICTHILHGIFHHEILGAPKDAAPRLYDRMTHAKVRKFSYGKDSKDTIDAPFQFYLPISVSYIGKLPNQGLESYQRIQEEATQPDSQLHPRFSTTAPATTTAIIFSLPTPYMPLKSLQEVDSFSINPVTNSVLQAPALVEQKLQAAGREKYRAEVIDNLQRAAQHALTHRDEQPSPQNAEVLLTQSLPGSYLILTKSVEEEVQLASCTHIGGGLYYHEPFAGSPKEFAEKFYERMTVCKQRSFLIDKTVFLGQFTLYIPFRLSYIDRTGVA